MLLTSNITHNTANSMTFKEKTNGRNERLLLDIPEIVTSNALISVVNASCHSMVARSQTDVPRRRRFTKRPPESGFHVLRTCPLYSPNSRGEVKPIHYNLSQKYASGLRRRPPEADKPCPRLASLAASLFRRVGLLEYWSVGLYSILYYSATPFFAS